MNNKYLLTAFSKDRPGIVADISRVLYEHECNIEDSSMTYLAGEFAILLMLSAPTSANDEVMEILSTECRRLEREKNITAYIRPLQEEVKETKNNFIAKTISVEGLDQTGIVYKVSQFLADSNININTLETKTSQSPHNGAAYYSMTITVEIPTVLSLHNLEDGLSSIGDELNVDISIS